MMNQKQVARYLFLIYVGVFLIISVFDLDESSPELYNLNVLNIILLLVLVILVYFYSYLRYVQS
ncbi:hypothetical protein C453_06546 [Haloferax elongans ATCC BAA-1513]|uniref:Uncharacterized protein n=1 Tax=Haloferax elongans ATCC BAA-1513 TaxID=1230453 RepID=M0HTV2_HALEO|nr:hypothetical protein C453_06546 [Haloferax elongans ATCC BAA-1513]